MSARKEIFSLIVLGCIFVLPVFWITRHLDLRLDSDYDYVRSTYTFLVDSIRTHHSYPNVNPYIGTGIPVIGDPLLPIFYPPVLLFLLTFGVSWGIRFLFLFSVIFSGIAMWVFLRTLGIRGSVGMWGAMMYEISGGIAARFAAGHMEKIYSYPLFPLFFATTMSNKLSEVRVAGIAVVISTIFFTGDIYALWYIAIFYIIIRGYFVITKLTSILNEIHFGLYLSFLTLLITLPKTYPMVRDVLPVFSRYYDPDPYAGSIHWFLSFLPFTMPLKMTFYDRPSLQRWLGFYYNWYEYYVFICPIPFLLLLTIKKSLKNSQVRLLIVLIIVGFLFASTKYHYSPFYWLNQWLPFLHMFRVPQRIFLPLTSLVLGLLAFAATEWKAKKKRYFLNIIFVSSFLWVFFTNQQTLFLAFESPRTGDQQVVEKLRQTDPSDFFVANFSCCFQTYLVQQHIPIINYYYPWLSKKSPRFIDATGTKTDFRLLQAIRPKYIIAARQFNFAQYFYVPIMGNNKDTIWKTDYPTVFPISAE